MPRHCTGKMLIHQLISFWHSVPGELGTVDLDNRLTIIWQIAIDTEVLKPYWWLHLRCHYQLGWRKWVHWYLFNLCFTRFVTESVKWPHRYLKPSWIDLKIFWNDYPSCLLLDRIVLLHTNAITLWRQQHLSVTDLLRKESTGDLMCFVWSAPKQMVEQKIETPVIWDDIVLIMTSL